MAWLPWRLHTERIPTNFSRQIESMEISLEATSCRGEIRFTDLMLQSGPVTTMWQGNPSELRWSDEYR